MSKNFFIVGGAGFIGSHFADILLENKNISRVTVFDNFSSGKKEHIATHSNNSRLQIIEGDVHNYELLEASMKEHDVVIHLASNPDIARAAIEPAIDFERGTLLTHYVLESMRVNKIRRVLYASGSGIYGDLGNTEIAEEHGPLLPISTYGASKLAGEALICSYYHMFGISGLAFRFGNVVGARQTHGVGFDFINKLRANHNELTILGDGQQSKSYVHVSDVIKAVLLADEKVKEGFAAFNVATGDYITVGEIAEIVIKKMFGDTNKVVIKQTGGDRGWKGDIPVVRLSIAKIRALGWQCEYSSKKAIESSIDEMLTMNNFRMV